MKGPGGGEELDSRLRTMAWPVGWWTGHSMRDGSRDERQVLSGCLSVDCATVQMEIQATMAPFFLGSPPHFCLLFGQRPPWANRGSTMLGWLLCPRTTIQTGGHVVISPPYKWPISSHFHIPSFFSRLGAFGPGCTYPMMPSPPIGFP